MLPTATLGVDFGTSHTVAVIRQGDGVQPLLFDGTPLLPSAVYAEEPGHMVVGRDAVHSARLRPERFEPNPKRRVDDGTVLLGDLEVYVSQLFAAVLHRVRTEAERVVGGVPDRTVVTHPAVWGPARRLVLSDACAHAGLEQVTLLPEPVAAAQYFARQPGTAIVGGNAVVVYDFGGGTFDASVVTATESGFQVLAVDGSDSLGGVDIDQALAEHIGLQFAGDARWGQLLNPTQVTQRRHHRTFLDDVRAAKERLSRHSRIDLLVPILDADTQVTREELEAITAPLLGKAVRLTQAVMRAAAVPTDRIAGVFLVGGASRMPLVATSLHRGTGIAPTIIDQPELVVATGATVEAEPLTPGSPVATPPATATIPVPVTPGSTAPLHSPVTTTPTPVSPPTIPAQPRTVPSPATPRPASWLPPKDTSATPPAPASPPIPGLKALLWVQFGLSIAQGVVIVAALSFYPPPEEYWSIAIAFLLGVVTLTVFIAIDAVRLARDSGRPRGSVTVVQSTVLSVTLAGVATLVILGVPYIEVIRAAILVPGVIAAVILTLVRLGRSPQPVTRSRILTELSGTLTIQLATATVALLIACAWWADFMNTSGAITDEDVVALILAALLLPAIGFILFTGAVHLSRLHTMTTGRRFLQVGQAAWSVVGALYALPWFYSARHRLMPFEIETTGGDYPMFRGWGTGIGDRFNELGLWMLVFSAVASILVLIQLTRLSTTTDPHETATV